MQLMVPLIVFWALPYLFGRLLLPPLVDYDLNKNSYICYIVVISFAANIRKRIQNQEIIAFTLRNVLSDVPVIACTFRSDNPFLSN